MTIATKGVGAGKALLTDFGLARSFVMDERMTADGGLVGTPAYMSPEQAVGDGNILGPASDQYSLGIVLFELLTGKLPFIGGAMSVIVNKATQSTPASIANFRPELDPQLVAIVEQAIRYEPAERFPDVGALAAVLRSWLETGVAPPPDATPTRSAVAANVADLPRTSRARLLRRLSVVVAGCALAAAMWLGVSGQWKQNAAEDNSIPYSAGLAARHRLSGNLKIKFFPVPGDRRDGHPLKVGDESPLFNGQRVQLRVKLDAPAYVYIIWIGSDGKADPIYPWDFGHSKAGWKAPLVRESESASDEIRCPAEEKKAFRAAAGPAGMQHVVILARTTPLEPAGTLQSAFADLPHSPLTADRDVARYFDWSGGERVRCGLVRGLDRSLAAGELVDLGEADEVGDPADFDESNEPVLQLLKSRLQKFKFDLIKVWRFAQTESHG
jgi:hypothetical protein